MHNNNMEDDNSNQYYVQDENNSNANDNNLSLWYPRSTIRRTNWLYRTDALRVSDLREITLAWELFSSHTDYVLHLLMLLHALSMKIQSSVGNIELQMKKTIKWIKMVILFLWSEAYCYFLDFLQIAYYPSSNRFTSFTGNIGPRFYPISCSTIDDLGINEARDMTGFTKQQLYLLLRHLRMPTEMSYPRKYRFSGEDALLHYLYWHRNGGTKLQMSTQKFGGDPRRFTYSIRLITDHLYTNFYHKVSGDSMRMWLPHIDSFRYAIWAHLQNVASSQINTSRQRYVFKISPLNHSDRLDF